MNESLKQEVIVLLKSEQMVFLATSKDSQPFLRPMTLIHNKDKFFFATGSTDTKTIQISTNPKVEICLLVKDEKYSGYIRASGKLVVVTDESVRKRIYDETSFLSYFWNEPTDPSYVLYQMTWEIVELMKPGEHKSTTFEW